ncbi:MAG: ATP-binding protein, partial [Candidatus Hydrogenedentota bacterium]
FIFLSAIFWLLDPFLKERLSIAVANITLIAVYLIAAQILLLVSGGLTSRFFLVYYFVVFTGAMSYGLSGSIAVTGLIALAYSTFIETAYDFPAYLVNMMILSIISLMVGFLAETKRRVERRETLQGIRLASLGEIARFMRELSQPTDVIEAGLDAAVRLLDADGAALMDGPVIVNRCGRASDGDFLTGESRLKVELAHEVRDLVIVRKHEPLTQDEMRIVRILADKMQLIWMHLLDKVAIAEARAEKEKVLDSIGSAVLTITDDGIVTTANRRAGEILELPTEGLVGTTVFGQPYLVPHPAEFGAEPRETQVGTSKGDTIPVEMRIMPRRDASDRIAGFIVVFDDLKELRRLRALIRRSEALAAVGEMAARVAHEIRNPLGGILGFLGLAERKASPEIAGYIAESKKAVRRLEEIVKNLLAFARPVPGTAADFSLAETWAEIERAEIARDAENISPPRAKVEPLQAGLVTVRLKGDPALFDRVVGNILRNAREAAGRAGAVALRVRLGDPCVWIEIDDNGPGWPQQLSDKLFEPFVSTKEEGSGLGLAISRRIVEELGGAIKCHRTRDDEGRTITRFRISWPRAGEAKDRSISSP